MSMVYLDNNATTKPAPEVVAAMMPYLTELYGNASSVYRFGQRARQAVDEARAQVAALIGCDDAELTFTAGGTEAINTALRGLLTSRAPRNQIVTSTVEHSAVRELCKHLGRDGAEILAVPVDENGNLDLERLESVVGPDTALVSIMWANNETGVVFPVDRIARLCKGRGVPFHCDATQAVGKVPIDVHATPIDAMSFASHKFHGPKGVGGMFVRKGVRVRPHMIGGPQERGRRGGTENVPGIVGMGKAAELAQTAFAKMPGVAALRDRFEAAVLDRVEEAVVIGGGGERVPNTTNIGFRRLEAEAILLLLSEADVCASAGSACSSGSLEPSPVLMAMGVDPKVAHGAIRFSLSRYTTESEIDRALEIIPPIITRLRAVLPVAV